MMKSKLRLDRSQIKRGKRCKLPTSWETKCSRRLGIWEPTCCPLKSNNFQQLHGWLCFKIISLLQNSNFSLNSQKNSFLKMRTSRKKWRTYRKIFKFTNKFSKSWRRDLTTQEESSRNLQLRLENFKNKWRTLKRLQENQKSKVKPLHKWKKSR